MGAYLPVHDNTLTSLSFRVVTLFRSCHCLNVSMYFCTYYQIHEKQENFVGLIGPNENIKYKRLSL
jgi:hypothetical protein